MELAKEIALLLKASCGKEVKEASVRQLYDATAKAILLHVEEDWQKNKKRRSKAVRLFIGRIFNRSVDLCEFAEFEFDAASQRGFGFV